MGKVQEGADGRMWNMCGIRREFKLDMDLRCESQYEAKAFGFIRSSNSVVFKARSHLRCKDTSLSRYLNRSVLEKKKKVGPNLRLEVYISNAEYAKVLRIQKKKICFLVGATLNKLFHLTNVYIQSTRHNNTSTNLHKFTQTLAS